jgi:hypothetical protein
MIHPVAAHLPNARQQRDTFVDPAYYPKMESASLDRANHLRLEHQV